MIVYLKCVNIENKLRVRIISENYFGHLNCKFPKKLRVENKIFSVDSDYISLIRKYGQKDFYSVKFKYILEENEIKFQGEIFQEVDQDECCICFDNNKYYVFVPCGHYYVCKNCGIKLEKCPLCRTNISKAVPFDNLNC